MKFLFNLLTFLVDLNHKKKIIYFFKRKLKNKSIKVIDVGAHKGETINLFSKNFNLQSIVCYEASKKNYVNLESFKKKKLNFEISIRNIALGSIEKEMDFFQTSESSSSTFCKIDFNSKYFKRKKKILDFFNKENYIIDKQKIKLHTLENEFKKFHYNKFDILKIDTEGFEFDVILGAKDDIKKIKYIYFEHHFDSMIIKNYKFSQINEYLNKYNFKKILKIKMPFRKTFEYIYENEFH
tara:strand:- start:423 stop:1139 length:717 start_codon:yes stop_codon:yes gene_type:complete